MKSRVKNFVANLRKDFKDAESHPQFIIGQLKRIPSRTSKIIRHTYQFTRKQIREKSLQRQTWPYLEEKHTYKNLLGTVGYQYFERLIKNSTNKQQALLEVSRFLANVGLTDYAIKPLQACLSLNPDDPIIHYYLQTLMFTSPNKYGHDFLYREHVKWGKTLVSGKPYTDYPNSLTTNRRLKIGYTCHFITNSTSTTLLLPLLKAHNRDRVEIFMYSDEDPKITPDEVRTSVEHWRDTYELSNDDFCEQVRKDQIDVLLELNGHCIINRYRALTRKPAPIQVNYYNYSATCGVPGIDYLLLGEDVHIDHLQPYFSEKLFHKKGTQLSTLVSSHFVPVSPSPYVKNGFITFGSFGQSHKLAKEQISLWCEILKCVPNSRLYMKANVFELEEYRSVFQKYFHDNAIESSRITLEGPSDYKTLLESYAKVDIALDTYPFGAGTTTIEACIQGVPVISLVGDHLPGKNGYINLNSIGHNELLATSKSEYIDLAVSLANDHKRLLQYRNTLRDDVRKSQRADMKSFISELEEAYYLMWLKYRQEHFSQ